MYALLIAQNPDERVLLSLVLQRAGFAVTTANDLHRAMETWQERPADLILAAEASEPLEQVRRIRAETEVPAILILEPVGEEIHYQILELGADLVLPRPYSVRLLMAQAHALMRRAGRVSFTELPTLSLAGLTLDPGARTVQVAGREPRRLTHLEFRLLYNLMIHRGQILTPEVIVERVWGYAGKGDTQLVRGLIYQLRAKVEPEPRTPRYVLTVPGVGYSFDPRDLAATEA
jgi:DNA-binding response OmpR family regulator